MTETTEKDLGERIRSLLTSVAARAGDLGYADGRREMEALRDRLDARGTTVVVAGEANTGKSSLLNALVGRPALLPTDHLVATNAPVLLRHGAPEVIDVWLAGEQKPHQAQLDELPHWATVAGWERRRADAADALPVAAIDVTLDAPELGDLVMVDTPGVGGLVAAHRDVTLEALARADALVFVLSSRNPAGDQELGFLADAVRKVPTVIVVQGKADGPPDAVEAVLAENRRLVGERLAGGGEWQIIPVSAHAAVSALTARAEGRAAEARTFDDVSGFAQLRSALADQVVARARLLRFGSAVRLAGGMLARCLAGVDARRLAVADDDVSHAARREQRVGVTAALGGDAAWRTALRDAVAELAAVLERDAARRIETRLEWAYGDLVANARVSDVNGLVRDLDREITALHAVLRRRYVTGLTRLVRTLQTMLGTDGLTGLLNDLAPADDERDSMPTVQGPSPFEGIDRDLLVSAGSAGLGVARVLTSGLMAGATGAAEIGGTGAAVATGSSAAVGPAVGGTAALALGPALVVGVFVGATVLGVRAYERYRAEQVQRAENAVERAVLAAREILTEFLTQTEALATDAAVLVELRLTERGRELDRERARTDLARHTGAAGLDEIRADLERLQNERVRLRDAVAAGLAD